MNKLNSRQRKYLKSRAHHLDPVLIIGRNGISDGTIESLSKALKVKELIKVKFSDFKSEKKQLSNNIEKLTKSHLVSIIGNIAIFFRQNQDPSKQIYKINNPK
tara:strand:+ start:418 stop:726 length:309 start_codon:yes stop_codon:yes gene_type:complete